MSVRQRTLFLGASFDVVDEEAVLAWIEVSSASSRFAYLVTPNVDHVVMLGEPGPESWRQTYRAAIAAADLCVNDSRILQRLARLSGVNVPVTPGSDIVHALVAHRREASGTLALVGARAEEAAWLQQALPKHRVLHLAPPMGVRDNPISQREIARFVEDARADVVFFAIGAPQSEIVCHAIAQRSKARGVGLCIGASVEFLSGAKRRAPRWMQRVGLEWLFRLASEPGRLWRRYLVRGPRVFGLWWQNRRPLR